jgi:hypothetical protein
MPSIVLGDAVQWLERHQDNWMWDGQEDSFRYRDLGQQMGFRKKWTQVAKVFSGSKVSLSPRR